MPSKWSFAKLAARLRTYLTNTSGGVPAKQSPLASQANSMQTRRLRTASPRRSSTHFTRTCLPFASGAYQQFSAAWLRRWQWMQGGNGRGRPLAEAALAAQAPSQSPVVGVAASSP